MVLFQSFTLFLFQLIAGGHYGQNVIHAKEETKAEKLSVKELVMKLVSVGRNVHKKNQKFTYFH